MCSVRCRHRVCPGSCGALRAIPSWRSNWSRFRRHRCGQDGHGRGESPARRHTRQFPAERRHAGEPASGRRRAPAPDRVRTRPRIRPRNSRSHARQAGRQPSVGCRGRLERRSALGRRTATGLPARSHPAGRPREPPAGRTDRSAPGGGRQPARLRGAIGRGGLACRHVGWPGRRRCRDHVDHGCTRTVVVGPRRGRGPGSARRGTAAPARPASHQPADRRRRVPRPDSPGSRGARPGRRHSAGRP